MIARLLVLALLLFATPAVAQDGLQGVWAMRAGGSTISRIEISRNTAGWSGVWVRPAHMELVGDDISSVKGPVERRRSSASRVLDATVELTFNDPTPDSIPDVFRIKLVASDKASLVYVGLPTDPFDLIRDTSVLPLGPWDSDKFYHRDINRPTNSEMTALFDADQEVRKHWEAADMKVVATQDQARRVKTQALLDSGALHSGNDFFHAAFVFQHGSTPGDYLKAHLLAMIAVARGRSDATWIASATLDRYLQSIKQPQVLGTQFRRTEGQPWTLEPYDRALVSDPLRTALGVPPGTEQEQQVVNMNKTVPTRH